MKTICLIISLAVLAIAVFATYLVNKEQRSLNRVSNTFIKLIRKFDSWQMMR